MAFIVATLGSLLIVQAVLNVQADTYRKKVNRAGQE